MKKIIATIALIVFFINIYSQDKLINIYSTSSTFYDGMADGGSSYSEEYIFIVKAKIILPYVLFDGNNVKLNSGDTLIISRSSYTPYNGRIDEERSDEETYFREQEFFYASKRNNCIYIGLTIQIIWTRALTYLYKGKKYVSQTKGGFDQSTVHAAP